MQRINSRNIQSLGLAVLVAIAGAMAAAVPTVALNPRFQESHRDNLNSVKPPVEEMHRDQLQALNERFREAREENMNS
ncbi:MAG: hypothetical protein VKK04_17420 [Synechococcales bacterium]|nr:hypothetical protein [Synechococcales bacterium]